MLFLDTAWTSSESSKAVKEVFAEDFSTF